MKKSNLILHTFLFNFIFLAISFCSFSATLPNGFVETRIATNLNPTDIEVAPDGRLFYCDKSGIILIYKNGSWLSTPFLSIPGIVDDNNERGLQSIVFDPDFANNQYVYIFYTRQGTTNNNTPVSTNSYNKVSRYTCQGDIAQLSSETTIIEMPYLSSSGVHNGGGMVFGTDGKLYIASGENGNTSYSQNSSSNLGKVLRINKDGTIPSDNPYFNTFTGVNRAIYNLGLRNPFKMAVQPITGKIFVNDVGSNSFEEINEVNSSKNFGWPGIEGMRTNQNMPLNYQDPLFAYGRSDGCSITAGTFYNPSVSQFPTSIIGKYLYSDYCNGYIRQLDIVAKTTTGFITGINRPLDVAIDGNGSIYYIARAGLGGGSNQDNTSSSNGEIWRVDYTGNGNVSFAVQPQGVAVSVGNTANFVCSANGNAPISYQWYKNNTSIAGANSSFYTTTTTSLADNGAQFKVKISNLFSNSFSGIAILTVNPNLAPNATITSPLSNFLYKGGDVLSFSGFATDPEDGTLLGSAFTWYIDFHHDTHTHPALAQTSGFKNGTYTVPTSGETADNVWFRIHLKIKDSKNAETNIYKDIFPAKVVITLTSNINSFGALLLDGNSVTLPHTFTSVQGIERNLEAPLNTTFNGMTYSFSGWSNGASRTQLIYPLANNNFYQANYSLVTNTLTGILESNVDSVKSLYIYPNPNKGEWILECGDWAIGNQLIISNSIGKLVYKQPITNLKTKINSNLPQGIYTINVENIYSKLIVE